MGRKRSNIHHKYIMSICNQSLLLANGKTIPYFSNMKDVVGTLLIETTATPILGIALTYTEKQTFRALAPTLIRRVYNIISETIL